MTELATEGGRMFKPSHWAGKHTLSPQVVLAMGQSA